jgi:Xaa-Pro aminopeptidase
MWSEQQIEYHKRAAKLLTKIKDLVFAYIRKNRSISEYDVQQFILRQFKKYNLISDSYAPIVAFAENTAFVHYYPKKRSKILEPESLILLDIWARLKIRNAPFADITWMAYYGSSIPAKIQKVFKTVIRAKEKSLNHIEKQLAKEIMPTGRELDKLVIKIIADSGYDKNFLHHTGHSLGIIKDHGTYPGISIKNKEKIHKNLGYTIEPGIYLPGDFGVRSEIDFYVSVNNKLIVTTNSQKNISII